MTVPNYVELRMALPHLLLVTSDAMLASFLGRLLAEAYHFTVSGRPAAIRALQERSPANDAHCDVMAVDARHLAPAEVAAFMDQSDHPAVVMLAPRGLRTESIPAGVRGALTHRSEEHELRFALEVVRSGQRYISPHYAAEDRLRYWQSPTPPTARQREVFELKYRGLTNDEIAVQLGVKRKAVEAIATELRIGLGLDPREVFNWRDGHLR